MPSLRITSSWDDGHVLDMRVAALLERVGMTGTFYVARHFVDERLSVAQIRQLAQKHEIGAHTISHPVLTEIPLPQAQQEMTQSKQWLEDVIGQAVQSFCYPKGQHNRALQQLARESGYRLARTVTAYQVQTGDNAYAMPTTLQVYPYPLRPLPAIAWWRGWRTRWQPLREALAQRATTSLVSHRHWRTHVLAWADRAAQQDGLLHLWGHSWELEQYHLWEPFAEVLDLLAQRYTLIPMTNSEALLDG